MWWIVCVNICIVVWVICSCIHGWWWWILYIRNDDDYDVFVASRWRPCWWWYRMHIGIMYRCITRPCMSLICICVWWVNVIGKLHVGDVVNLFVLMNNFEVELSIVQLIEVLFNVYIFTLIMIDVKLTPSGLDRLPICMNG